MFFSDNKIKFRRILICLYLFIGFIIYITNQIGPVSEAINEVGGNLPVFSTRFELFTLTTVLYCFFLFYIIFQYTGNIILVRRKIHHKHERRGGVLDVTSLEDALRIISIAFAFIVSLYIVGIDLSALGILSGLTGLGLTYALKDLLQNFFAGLILIWDGSLKTGDVISVGKFTGEGKNVYGWIDEMHMRYTIIKDRNDLDLLVPNFMLMSNPIKNWTRKDDTVRLKLTTSVAYNSDLDKVFRIMSSVPYEIERVLADPPPKPTIMNTGESGIDVQLRFWIKKPRDGIRNVKSQVYKFLIERFRDEHIEIPFPRRNISIIDQNNDENTDFDGI